MAWFPKLPLIHRRMGEEQKQMERFASGSAIERLNRGDWTPRTRDRSARLSHDRPLPSACTYLTSIVDMYYMSGDVVG